MVFSTIWSFWVLELFHRPSTTLCTLLSLFSFNWIPCQVSWELICRSVWSTFVLSHCQKSRNGGHFRVLIARWSHCVVFFLTTLYSFSFFTSLNWKIRTNRVWVSIRDWMHVQIDVFHLFCTFFFVQNFRFDTYWLLVQDVYGDLFVPCTLMGL